jgi:hypothetical protein
MDAHGTNGSSAIGLILKIGGAIGSAALVLVSCISAYFNLVGRIDRLDERMAQQSKQLEAFAQSVKSIAERAATGEEVDAKIERACLQMQIANQGTRWTCPFSGVEPKAPRRAAVPPPKAVASETWSLFGTAKQ